MKKIFTGTAAAAVSLAFATGAFAVGPPYTENHPVAVITPPTAGAAECQAAIAKNSHKYIKSVLKIRSKCLSTSVDDADPTLCPNTDDDEKAQKAANKSLTAIADACGTTAGLGNSYSGEAGADVASCVLGQNHAALEIYVGETHGAPAGPNAPDCQLAINKAANKLLPTLLKTANKCIETKINAGETTDLGAKCVGSSTTLVVTQPTDGKTNDKFNKSILKAWDQISDACETLPASEIQGLYGCPGASTWLDLQQCVEGLALNAVYTLIKQQYTESGTFVQHAPGALQLAVTAASSGDKLLIEGGANYEEGVTFPPGACSVSLGACPGNKMCSAVSQHPGKACAADEDCYGSCSAGSTNPGAECTIDGDCPSGTCQVGTCIDACSGGPGDECVSPADNVQIVGCGAATNERPRIIPPSVAPPIRGIQAVGVDGLHFEGLDVTGWSEDGIFVTGASGVSFRDIFGDGDNLSTPAIDSISKYAVFPIMSTDVVVEGTEVVNVRDAGIYVGQSERVLMRHNYITDCVSGMELENSKDGEVYGNTMTANTGGLLVFKLPTPEHQVAGGHYVYDNVSFSNNTPNFAEPGTTVSAVPMGTGIMVISDDDSVYENNQVIRNGSYGFLILDQVAINALAGNIFDPPSYDQDSDGLSFLNNFVPSSSNKRNGTAPEKRCQGGDDNGEVCTDNSTCESSTCADTLFIGNWTWAQDSEAMTTCWDPIPDEDYANAILGNTSFPLCP